MRKVIGPLCSGFRPGLFCTGAAMLLLTCSVGLAAAPAVPQEPFPPPLTSYASLPDAPLLEVLKQRIQAEPFDLLGTVIFFLAIVHTFMAPVFMKLSHRLEHAHQARLARAGKSSEEGGEVHFWAQIFHFLGEVEAVFGIWVVPVLLAVGLSKGWHVARDYLGHGLNFTEPLFVVVIMTIAASRPILKFVERIMAQIAILGRCTPAAWWLTILTVGPLLGSFITEPAAMTICALLLAERIYQLGPSKKLAYATLGLLFVNISVGGTLTHFAAPPVLMVASKWGWGLSDMLVMFGWKAALGIVAANLLYYGYFRREFKTLAQTRSEPVVAVLDEPVPVWITVVHIFFLGWTVVNNHFPVLFLGGFLFYLAFTEATAHHQSDLALRPALLVGFFLAGLVVHGSLQGWWIEPVLTRLDEKSLFFGAAVLTAFNDNAAITYLASLVPGFSEQLKYAVVAGAVAAGGLTVIANAPNPAGQSILSKFFPDGVSPWGLLLGALLPTLIMAAAFLLF
ncbi:MAG TPA: putative Na+/H+ antiporter [Clostridia bacterium]|nr:putative Na+/H+ antiporter [Clostridia bacterium]